VEVLDFADASRETIDLDSEPLRPLPPFALYVCSELLTHTRDRLWQKGMLSKEEVVLWGGYSLKHAAALTSILMPETESYGLHVKIKKDEQIKIVEYLKSAHQLLFADVHTHPGSDTTLSVADRMHPVSYKVGFLSIIVPSYAEGPLDLKKCGIWERVSQGWKPLNTRATARRFEILSRGEICDVLKNWD